MIDFTMNRCTAIVDFLVIHFICFLPVIFVSLIKYAILNSPGMSSVHVGESQIFPRGESGLWVTGVP